MYIHEKLIKLIKQLMNKNLFNMKHLFYLRLPYVSNFKYKY